MDACEIEMDGRSWRDGWFHPRRPPTTPAPIVQLRYAPLVRPLHDVVTLHFALRVSSLLYYIPTTFLLFSVIDRYRSFSLFFRVKPIQFDRCFALRRVSEYEIEIIL